MEKSPVSTGASLPYYPSLKSIVLICKICVNGKQWHLRDGQESILQKKKNLFNPVGITFASEYNLVPSIHQIGVIHLSLVIFGHQTHYCCFSSSLKHNQVTVLSKHSQNPSGKYQFGQFGSCFSYILCSVCITHFQTQPKRDPAHHHHFVKTEL